MRELPVGPHRHPVRFVDSDDRLWAVKELPRHLAEREYRVLRRLEEFRLPAARPAGIVLPGGRDAILITRYLDATWQYRRVFLNLPPDQPAQRARLLDAMVTLLVELHRHGVFWGNCSLANTLFSRDGQLLQAWFVDAETSEVHPSLSDGQRRHDLDILIENVAMGLLDLAARLDRLALSSALIAEAQGIADRYHALWDLIHAEPTFAFTDRYRVEGTVHRLNDLGFTVDEVDLTPRPDGRLRLSIRVGERNYHAQLLRQLTGLDVGAGQAAILLGDFRSYRAANRPEIADHEPDLDLAARWVLQVLNPGMARAHAAVGRVGEPLQAYCDLLEVRWLLSERAGRDVGDAAALAELGGAAPTDSAARLSIGELPSTEPD